MGLAYPTVNGTAWSYANISLNAGGQYFTSFSDINYSFKRTRTKIRGNNPNPLSKTMGEIEYSCDFTIEFSEFAQFLAQLGAGFSDQFFQILVSYVNDIQLPGGVIVDTIQGCTIDEIGAQMKSGPEGVYRKLTTDPLNILWNGASALVTPPVAFQQTALTLNQAGTGSGQLG
jgi:hypothetical protein